MKTIYTITNRNFTTLEFAQKFATKNNLDFSLISVSQIKDFPATPKNIFIAKENVQQYQHRKSVNA